MKQLTPDENWPDLWKRSYASDLLEIYGHQSNPGYSYAYRNRIYQAIDLVRRAAPPGASVLDVAAGHGNLSLLLADLNYRVTWNDLREELAGYVRLKDDSGRVEYMPGNLLDLKGDSQYDVVVIAEMIEHVAHPDEVLRRITSLVRPGGSVVLTTPNGEYFRNRLPRFSDFCNPDVFESVQFKPDADGHIFLLHIDELQILANTVGLVLERVNLFTNPLTNGRLRTEPLLRHFPENWIWGLERAGQRLPYRLKRSLHVGVAALMSRPSATTTE